MAMTSKEFKELYTSHSMDLLGSKPNHKLVNKAYHSYLALVDFTDSDGTLEFEKTHNNEQMRLIFVPEK